MVSYLDALLEGETSATFGASLVGGVTLVKSPFVLENIDVDFQLFWQLGQHFSNLVVRVDLQTVLPGLASARIQICHYSQTALEIRFEWPNVLLLFGAFFFYGALPLLDVTVDKALVALLTLPRDLCRRDRRASSKFGSPDYRTWSMNSGELFPSCKFFNSCSINGALKLY
jgi:hypothetical protein